MTDTTHGPPAHDPRALPAGTRVQEYEILRYAEGGGFSLVYLARDTSLGRQVALKEYMPPMASRAAGATQVTVSHERDARAFASGLRRFINDARLLARFDQAALVKVHRFWEEHGTAYMSMPFYEGTTLQRAVAEKRVAVDESSLRQMLAPLLDALAALHDADCCHRDISPDNILLTGNGRVLLDFGVARTVITNAAQSFHVILKEGYAPLEQYASEGPEGMRQGPWSDIYSLCAVFRYAITGIKPQSAVVRSASRKDPLEPLVKAAAGRYGEPFGRYSEPFLRAIDAGMAIAVEGRPQSIAALRALLDEEAPKPEVLLLPPAPAVPEQLAGLIKTIGSACQSAFSRAVAAVPHPFAHSWARKTAVAALLPVIVLAAFLGVRWAQPPHPAAAYAASRSGSSAAALHTEGAAVVTPRASANAGQGSSAASASPTSPDVPQTPAAAAADATPAGSGGQGTPAAPVAAVAPVPSQTASGDVEEAPAAGAGSQESASAAPAAAASSSAKPHEPKAAPRAVAHKSSHSESSKPPEPRVAAAASASSATAPSTTEASAAAPGTPAAAAVPAPPAAPPVPAPPPPPPASAAPPSPVERSYMVNVAKMIRTAAVVPDSPELRAALMRVKTNEPVSISFVLDRSGKVIQVAVERTTGSEKVDKLAVQIVGSRQYPPFPDTAWPGVPSHGFTIPIALQLPP